MNLQGKIAERQPEATGASFALSLSRFLISPSVMGIYPSETLHVVHLIQSGFFLLQISFL